MKNRRKLLSVLLALLVILVAPTAFAFSNDCTGHNVYDSGGELSHTVKHIVRPDKLMGKVRGYYAVALVEFSSGGGSAETDKGKLRGDRNKAENDRDKLHEDYVSL